jgi:arylsulfatase A-like enzyme
MNPLQVNSAPVGYTQESRRPLLSGYFAAVTAMDRGVGHILDWLETHDLLEDTLVLFSSDNGMNMGHHGIFGKGNGTFPFNMYDTSVKVPMIISRPGHVPQGVTNSDLLSHYDLYPTILDLIGLPNLQMGSLPGRSFVPIFSGYPLTGRDKVVVFDEYGPTRMIRNREWKYVHRYPYGPNELYDLVNDPDERKNLVGETHYKQRVVELKAHLDSWFMEYVDPQFDGVREAVTGKGQVTWAGPRGKGRKAFADDWKYLKDDLAEG